MHRKIVILSLFVSLILTSTISAQNSPKREGTPGIPGLEASKSQVKDGSNILIEPLSASLSPDNLASAVLGTGIDISNVSYTGSFSSSGIFSNGSSTGIDFESGIILSSGLAQSLLGPNNYTNTSNSIGTAGDAQLDNIISATTYDAAILEFDFVPNTDYLTFNYVLFSEEYPEYLNFTDVFAFFLDGENIALIPGTTSAVSIGTINHTSYADYYVSNQDNLFNVQADGFTTVLTAAADVTKGETHHIKLAIADMGDRIYDSWVLVEGSSFSSLGTVKGIVYDSETGQPVADAQIEATGNHQAYTATNSDGEYIILNLPFGYGYELTAYAPGYQKKVLSDINVLQEDPLLIKDIYLDPIEGDFIIQSLDPDPNPNVSTAMPNAKEIHRYYYVKNLLDNTPGAGIPVYITDGSETYMYLSDEDGIVDVRIKGTNIPGQVGSVTNYEIVKLLNKDLEDPIHFKLEIIDANYSKYWAEENNINGSFSNFHGGLSTNSATRINENYNAYPDPEHTFITLGENANFGIGTGAGIEGMIKVNDFTVGASATAGVKADAKIYNENSYNFNYLSNGNKDAIAKYYLYSKANFGLLDNSLIRLGSIVEDFFIDNYLLDEYFESESGGIILSGSGNAGANLGYLTPFPMQITAGAEVSAEISENIGTIYSNAHQLQNYFGLSARAGGSANSKMLYTMPSGKIRSFFEENLDFLNNEISGDIQIGLSLTCNRNQVEIAFLRRQVFKTGWETIEKYIITGKDVLYYFNSIDVIGAFANHFDKNTGIAVQVSNTSFMNMVVKIFSTLMELSEEVSSANFMISYEKYRTDFTEDEPLDLYIGLDVEALLSVGVSLGGGTSIEEGKSKLIEHGKLFNFRHLPLESYTTNIENIPVGHEEIVQSIIDEIPLSLRILIGTYQVLDLFSPLKAPMEEITFPLGEGGSSLTLDPAIVPEGIDSLYCVSWGWYGENSDAKGEKISNKSKAIFDGWKESAQESYRLEYGIGGFYQIEPINTQLLGKAQLTIRYEDEEIESLDESQLGIYIENKSDRKWEYIGGDVDPESNLVKADIDKLGLYTLAPAIPDGEIILTADKDTIPADGSSTIEIVSEPIYYNNGVQVNDNELFTVFSSNGTLLNDDLDDATDGIQVAAIDGVITLELRASHFGIQSIVSLTSENGYAEGEICIFFNDEVEPQPPVLTSVEGFNTSIKASWNSPADLDIAGYKVYFDTDSGEPPFEGVAKINGSPSPVSVGMDTLFTIIELFTDSTYYVAVTSVDIAGNESEYSNVLNTNLYLNERPEIGYQEFTFTGLCNDDTYIGTVEATDPDEDDITYSIVSGKNDDMFEIDAATGELSLKTGYRMYDTLQNILVEIKDNGPGNLSETGLISITSQCTENHAPIINDQEFELVDTSMNNGYSIGSVDYQDEDNGQSMSFRMLDPDAQSGLKMDSLTGEISISDASMIEFNDAGRIKVTTIVQDNGEGRLSDTAEVSILLINTVNLTLRNTHPFNIYPNPAENSLFVASRNTLQGKLDITILSMRGKVLHSDSRYLDPGAEIEVDLSDLLPGMYIITLENSNLNEIGYFMKR